MKISFEISFWSCNKNFQYDLVKFNVGLILQILCIAFKRIWGLQKEWTKQQYPTSTLKHHTVTTPGSIRIWSRHVLYPKPWHSWLKADFTAESINLLQNRTNIAGCLISQGIQTSNMNVTCCHILQYYFTWGNIFIILLIFKATINSVHLMLSPLIVSYRQYGTVCNYLIVSCSICKDSRHAGTNCSIWINNLCICVKYTLLVLFFV